MHLPLPKIDTHFLECKGKDSLTPPVTFFVYWGRGMWVTLVSVTPPPMLFLMLPFFSQILPPCLPFPNILTPPPPGPTTMIFQNLFIVFHNLQLTNFEFISLIVNQVHYGGELYLVIFSCYSIAVGTVFGHTSVRKDACLLWVSSQILYSINKCY